MANRCLKILVFVNFCFIYPSSTLIIKNLDGLKFIAARIKRDVTVVQTHAGDPCPTIVDSNRVVGAGFHYGPTVNTNLYGQGQRQNPLQGFKSWGGNLGANNVGIKGGWDFGIPIGSKVLDGRKSGCAPTAGNGNVQTFPAQQPQPQPQPFPPAQTQPPNPFQGLPTPPPIIDQPNPQPQPQQPPPNPFGNSLPTPPPIDPNSNSINPTNPFGTSSGSKNPFDNSGLSPGDKILVQRQLNQG